MFKQNISDGEGGEDKSNGTPLYPPLFWLDNIFKKNISDGVRSRLIPLNTPLCFGWTISLMSFTCDYPEQDYRIHYLGTALNQTVIVFLLKRQYSEIFYLIGLFNIGSPKKIINMWRIYCKIDIE